ncbi:pentatricopeptide repeat-containing protein At3g26782, mitochondrial-like [Phoenix dactylifera]|uniref:Pentatricopeptide repeat-containing protein At3g26782, mitochondrial-like n=1 Tax=Phoenix dactylifera TaxID=42345 RepID=A0A8B9AIS1_PHODC|nr:pentatricopeptide repeat-containing protein At3g26782, mitochondrial-like [Phoenix dactylifera]XP_038983174.1 pentatricopeptide repeat-containing protein At3g26782, mitochondrial-like [Phoenix dactylifera]
MTLRNAAAFRRALHSVHPIPNEPPPPLPRLPEPRSSASLLNGCTSLRALKPLHASVLRLHPDDLFLSATLASRYALLGSSRHALSVLSSAPPPPPSASDPFLWNILLRAFADAGAPEHTLAVYRRMRDPSGGGARPDRFTFPPVLKACGHLRDLQTGAKVHRDTVEFGYCYDVFVGNSLIAMYGKGGALETARRVFDEMSERNVVTWTAMIGASAQNGHTEEALSLFHSMLDGRVRPNRATFLNVMPCVFKAEEADDLYKLIGRQGLDSDMFVQNAMVGMYSRCGKIEFARHLFDRILEKDLASWSSMIEGYARADMFDEALKLFRKMKLAGILLDHVILLGIIRACSNSLLASLQHAQFIHGFVVRNLLDQNLMVQTALIDLYVKRGSLRNARRIFDQMQQKNLVSWSTMVSGYGMHGRGEDALKLFICMKGSVKPDHIVFVSVLSACSHAGLIDEGWQCFNSMVAEFGIVPRAEHYACMVDLLGRAGQLKEAREFIERMPIKPDSSVWGSLLGACRIHPNAEIAELAAKSLFELEPENSGRYILLSNIYTSLGKIEEAHRIRALMRRRGVRKIAGYTIIEVKNKVYKFFVGDRMNPQSHLIYKELERLMDRIRMIGYVPNTNFALHDVEEETKEKSLYVHSEKLAIVFGLLNSGPGCVIQIRKNLRVCGDCHTATKFISKITGREIVVRDSHRFHHFSDGVCSCGDYW